jgi:hypothetical protein
MAEFGIENGLTCALAKSLTRDAIFDALKRRRCYGVTGARMLLDFSADDHLMGSVIRNQVDSMTFRASVVGCAPLESLQLFRGKEAIYEAFSPEFDDLSASNRIRMSWQGSRERGRQRRVTWDGVIRLTDCRISDAAPFSFDSVMDGLGDQTEDAIAFRSHTTGDRDGIDLWLENARNGQLEFDSAAGKITLDLAELKGETRRKVFDLGGVDMRLVIERYPEETTTLALELEQAIAAPPDQLTPYFVKATQVDGQMAWSSPIYVDNRIRA